MSNPLAPLADKAQAAAALLAEASAEQKNAALAAIADGLRANIKALLAANAKDLEAARAGGMAEAMQDRLSLDEKRIGALADSLAIIAALPDPVGRLLETVTRPTACASKNAQCRSA